MYFMLCKLLIAIPGLKFSIPGFRIEKFVIQKSRFGIRLLDWSSFWYPQLTYFMYNQTGDVV